MQTKTKIESIFHIFPVGLRCDVRFRLIGDFNGIFEYITFGFFSFTLSGVCCYTLILLSQLVEHQIHRISFFSSKSLILSWLFFVDIVRKSKNESLFGILNTLVQTGNVFISLFVYCEFGERVTHQFNQFNEQFCDCRWYSLPMEMQRIYSIVLVGVQQSVIIEGYSNTVCTRDAFKKVILMCGYIANSVYSYQTDGRLITTLILFFFSPS